jgi:hypothetical protein
MTDARDTARLEAEAVRMVTGLLRDNPEADDEPLALTIVAGLKAAGWRPTVLAESLEWRTASTPSAGAQIPAKARDWVLGRAADAVAQQEAAARARVKAQATGHDQDGGR